MADSFVQVPADGVGKKLDTRTQADGDHREVIVIGDPTATDIATVDTNGLDVDVTRLPAIPAGTNNIGDVDVASIAAGDNNIGNVDVVTLPVIPAGTNNIGDVDVLTVPAPLSTVGGGTEAAALRVTLASDSTGVVSVDDNGGALTVDGTVTANLAAGTNNIGDVDVLSLPAIPAGTNNIGDVDVLSVVPGTGATSQGKAVDSVAGATDTGIAPLAVRDDALTTLTPVDGDYVPLRTDSTGALWTRSTSAAGGTSSTDEAAFTAGSSTGTPVMAAFDDVSPDVLAEGTVGIIRSTTNRALHVNLRDASGSELAVGGGTQYDEDTVSAAADKITMAGVVRKDTAATLVGTDGDRTQLQVDAIGRLYVNASGVAVPITDNAGSLTVDGSVSITGAIPAGTNNIGDVDVLTVPAPLSTSGGGTEATALRVTLANDSTGLVSVDDNGGSLTVDGTVAVSTLPALVAGSANIGDVDVLTLPALVAGTANIGDVDIASGPTAGSALQVQGTAAHDAATAGNPVLGGAQMETMADSAPGTRSGTDGDATKLATSDGALYVIPTGPQTWSYHADGSTALTDASVHAAPSAGLSIYVTDIVCSSGAATAMNIFFEEGASKVLGPYYLEAVAGRGLAIHFGTPKKITAATALTVTTSAAIAHAVDVTGFIAPG